MDAQEKIRQRIIHAASERFRHYGFGKTSMAEIAADCDMSPGNLYRYFKNKLDIAESIVRRSLEKELVQLRDVVRAPGCSAAVKLENFILQELRYTYKQFEDYPTFVEHAHEIVHRRPLLIDEFLAASRALLAEILAMGNATGEFQVEDVVIAAEVIQSATLKFRYPQLYSKSTLERLEEQARKVVKLLILGLNES